MARWRAMDFIGMTRQTKDEIEIHEGFNDYSQREMTTW